VPVAAYGNISKQGKVIAAQSFLFLQKNYPLNFLKNIFFSFESEGDQTKAKQEVINDDEGY
jgi:hypothetical protein